MTTTYNAGSLPADYFAGGAGLSTGELARVLNELATATRTKTVSLRVTDLVSANAAVYRYTHLGANAQLTKVVSILSGALTVGNATITMTINGAAFTDTDQDQITITQSGSAAGDQDSVTPDQALVDGDVIQFTVGGTNTASRFADLTLLLTY